MILLLRASGGVDFCLSVETLNLIVNVCSSLLSSDSSIVSSTEERMKSLVNVEMVVQNRVTRVTYRVTSTAPIGMILTKVSLYQWQPWACPEFQVLIEVQHVMNRWPRGLELRRGRSS